MPDPYADLPADDLTAAHRHSIRHRLELERSDRCGCFCCGATFDVSEINEWANDDPSRAEKTAICPRCGIDSVIGSASGFPITAEFLERMRQRWFGRLPSVKGHST